MLHTTLNAIRNKSPCPAGWNKLLKHLGKTEADDELLPFSTILESNGLNDALWCCRAAPQYAREWRLYAVWCAQQFLPLMKDERSRNALVVAEAFANGLATIEELAAAWAAARDAARDARDAARDAWDAARDAAGDAAWAAWAAAGDAARAAWAAVDAARAAWDAAGDAQVEVFKWIVDGGLAEFESK